MLEYLLLITIILLIYASMGYPAILFLLSKMFPKNHIYDRSYQPSATIIISAYNEQTIIDRKLENTLSLDYPRDKLRIIVVSDGSTDRTDDIVRSFGNSGIELLRTNVRCGKTAGINLAMERITTDIVIFSDANALYDRSAVRNLVRHFSDSSIGYVVGYSHYDNLIQNAAANSEHLYWDIEVRVKQLESDFSSIVGGDGAIYAIRRELFESLLASDINDFVNPLQIVSKGYRGIFDKEAWCSEKPAAEFQREFARKIRITNRSFNAILRLPALCNPLKFTRFAWQLVSHKLLRWFSPFIILIQYIIAIISSHNSLAMAIIVFYGLGACTALLGSARHRKVNSKAAFYIPYYFVLMNLAMIAGVMLRFRGKTISIWDTVRERSSAQYQIAGIVPFLLAGVILLSSIRICFWYGYGHRCLQVIIFLGLYALFHTYLGYPIILGLLALFRPTKTVRDNGYCPDVTLLILAYNEEKEIEAKLLNCMKLAYPRERLQIVVASDGSTDGTNEIIKKYVNSQIRLLDFSSNRGKVAALNDAMRQIDSEIVVFSDANVMYERQAIAKLVRNFADSRVGAVSGKVKLLDEEISYREAEALYYTIEHFIQAKESETGGMIGADGAMYAIRRALFEPPPEDTILDDFAIPMDIACRGNFVLHEEQAYGFEKNVQEIHGEFRRKARIIAGGIQCLLRGFGIPSANQKLLAFKFVSHKLLRWFLGPITIVLSFLLLGIQLMAPNRIFSVALYVILGWVFISIIGQVFRFARKVPVIAVCHYLMMMNIAAIAGCYLGFTGRQQVKWKSSTTPKKMNETVCAE